MYILMNSIFLICTRASIFVHERLIKMPFYIAALSKVQHFFFPIVNIPTRQKVFNYQNTVGSPLIIGVLSYCTETY